MWFYECALNVRVKILNSALDLTGVSEEKPILGQYCVSFYPLLVLSLYYFGLTEGFSGSL